MNKNHPGQTDLLDYLENLLPTSNEIVFNKPLQGELDFSILKDCHFDNITSITLESGEVTHIQNLPKTLLKLNVSNNKIEHLNQLPENIVDLNLSFNFVKKLDVKHCSKLVSLEASDNELVELHLPNEIESIMINNNKLQELDLNGLAKLKTLHCNGNPLLSIRNFPTTTIEDFRMENNPVVHIFNKIDPTDTKPTPIKINISAEDAIRKYYTLKQQYDSHVYLMKKKQYENARNVKNKNRKREIQREMSIHRYPCIKCGRPVNTLFSKKNEVYKVSCGDPSNPCGLDIEIHAAAYYPFHRVMDVFKNDLEDDKEEIIKLKMDTLFNYRTDKSAVTKFNKQYKRFMETEKIYQETVDTYDSVFFGKEKKERIKEKTKTVFEIQETMRKLLNDYKKNTVNTEGEKQQKMRDIMMLYKNELLPACKNIQTMKHEVMEITTTESTTATEHRMISLPVGLSKMDYLLGDLPVVKKYML